MRVLFIFGTRPEAIKLLPVILQMKEHSPDLIPRICVTAQHRDLLDQVLRTFNIQPDHDLNVMAPGQTLSQTTARILMALESVLQEEKPALVVVQGDTSSTFCGALAAFYQQVPIAHIEAGLRTGDMTQPFPEEMNRLATSKLASLHLAPTAQAEKNLLLEGVPREQITVTGNTGIDTLQLVQKGLESGSIASQQWSFPSKGRRLIVATAHRRESFGDGLAGICTALRELASRSDTEIAFPVHPNPQIQTAFISQLGNVPNIHILPPLDYVPFIDLMRRAHLLITDSGGIQEEGPSLGKPILVLRERTERPEAIEAGSVHLVGTTPARILEEAHRLLDQPSEYDRRAFVHHPYGDGNASERICHTIAHFLGA